MDKKSKSFPILNQSIDNQNVEIWCVDFSGAKGKPFGGFDSSTLFKLLVSSISNFLLLIFLQRVPVG